MSSQKWVGSKESNRRRSHIPITKPLCHHEGFFNRKHVYFMHIWNLLRYFHFAHSPFQKNPRILSSFLNINWKHRSMSVGKCSCFQNLSRISPVRKMRGRNIVWHQQTLSARWSRLSLHEVPHHAIQGRRSYWFFAHEHACATCGVWEWIAFL